MPWATTSPTSPGGATNCGGIFDFDAKAEKLEELSQALEDPKVWDDAERAQALGKEKKAAEGVVLTPQIKALFRNVPPALALALAQTEQHEKADRAELMRRHGCTELDAALMIADRIAASRRAE